MKAILDILEFLNQEHSSKMLPSLGICRYSPRAHQLSPRPVVPLERRGAPPPLLESRDAQPPRPAVASVPLELDVAPPATDGQIVEEFSGARGGRVIPEIKRQHFRTCNVAK